MSFYSFECVNNPRPDKESSCCSNYVTLQRVIKYIRYQFATSHCLYNISAGVLPLPFGKVLGWNVFTGEGVK